MVLDYFAYWNGGQIRDLFEAIVAITSGPSYQGLIKSAVLAGFLITLTTALFKWQGMSAKTFLFAAVLFYSVLLIPKVDLSIHDERAGTVHVVNNVPFGIGFFAATSSKIGHFLTSGFESAFALPEAEKFSKFGMVYPQRAVSVLQSIGAVTPDGRQMVSRFVADCVTPELIDYPDKVSELAHSSDIWSLIVSSGWLNPARNSIDRHGNVRACPDAAQDLDNHLQTSELDAIKKKLGTILVPDRMDPAQTIVTSLPHVETLLLGLTRSLDASLKHSVMIQAVPDGISSIAKHSASPLLMATNLSKAQANLAGEISYRTMSEVAKAALPKIRNCVEFVIIASFPLVFILLIAAGSQAGLIFRSFFVLIIWVQLWAPLYAVTNYLLITVDANPMNRIIAEYGGNSLMAVDLIRQTGASSQAIAGYLMIAIPMLALAIAKASDHAAVAMIGGLMAPSQAASQALSGQISAGNFSSGNLSSGNTAVHSVSGNKNDLSASYSDPYASKMTTGYGTVTRDGDNHVTGMSRTSVDLGVSSSSSIQLAGSRTNSSVQTSSLTRADVTNLTLSRSANSSDSSSVSFVNALNRQLTDTHTSAQSLTGQTSANVSYSSAQSHTASSGLSTSQNLSVNTAAGVAVGSGKGLGDSQNGPAEALTATLNSQTLGLNGAQASAGPADNNAQQRTGTLRSIGSIAGELAGVEAGLKTTTAQNLIDTATGANTAATAKQRSQAYSELKSAAQQIAQSTSDSKVKSMAQNFSASLDKAFALSNAKNSQLTRSSQVSQSLSSSETGSDTSTVNHDIQVMNSLLSRGHSAESALENLFHNRSTREDLGIRAAAEAKQRAETPDYMGSGQISSPQRQLDNNEVSEHHGFKNSEKESILSQNHADLNQQKEISARPLHAPINDGFVKSVKEQALDIDKRKIELENSEKQEQDEISNNVTAYQNHEKGLGTVLSVALAGGLGYSSPLNNEKEN